MPFDLFWSKLFSGRKCPHVDSLDDEDAMVQSVERRWSTDAHDAGVNTTHGYTTDRCLLKELCGKERKSAVIENCCKEPLLIAMAYLGFQRGGAMTSSLSSPPPFPVLSLPLPCLPFLSNFYLYKSSHGAWGTQ